MQKKLTASLCSLLVAATWACVDGNNKSEVSAPTSEQTSVRVPYQVAPERVGRVVIAGGPHQTAHLPFDWNVYQDPARPEFWADGADGVLPRPFLHLAGEPSVENARKVIEWQKLQWKTIRKIIESLGGAAGLASYEKLLGVNVLEEVSKKDNLTELSQASPMLSQFKDEKRPSFTWDEVGIIYIYSSACSVCKKQHSIIENIKSLGAKVIPLQLGEGEPLYEDSKPYGTGDWASFFPLGKEVATPTMFIMHPGKSPKKHIGFISLSDLKGEIANITQGDNDES